MFGFPLIGYAIGYLLLAIVTTYLVVRSVRSRGATRRGRATAAGITLFVFWLIPYWDWLPTVIYHNYLCSTEAGMKIYRSVEGVNGVLEGGPWPISIGYRYGYANNHSGGYIRFRKNPDKSSFKPWIEEPAPEPPLYGVKLEQTSLKPNIGKRQYVVYAVSTNEVLATLTDFTVTTAFPYGSLYELRKAFWPFTRPCLSTNGGREQLQKEMVLKTLKPLQTNN